MELSPELMFKIISNNYPSIGLKEITKVEEVPGVPDNQNFLSFVWRVTSHGVTVENQTAVVKTVVKKGERGVKKSGFEVKHVFFHVEAQAYDFLNDCCNWFRKNGFKIKTYWPDCLYKSINENVFLIMLEDLKETGYKMMEKCQGLLDTEHVFIAVDRLARCHAMSRVYISEVPANLKDWPKPRFEFLKNFWKNGLRVLSEVVVKYNANWDYIADYMLNLRENVFDKYLKCYDDVSDYFPVLSLGDCWCNNIMFKYSKENQDQPTDVRFIDFQFSYVTSFAWDLYYLIYITLKPKLRMKIIDDLLIMYQKVFEQTVISLNGDSKLFPTLNEIHTIMDKLLLPEFLYSSISVVEISSVQPEDFSKTENTEEDGFHLSKEWFLRSPEEEGYIDNIRYFELKGLFNNTQ